jgi:hypothetical protein
MFSRWWRPRSTTRSDVLLQLTPRDALTRHQAYEGVLGLGSTGSGKSSTLQQLMAALMLRGAGMLVLTAKADDFAAIAKVANETGRGHDLRRFAPGEPWRFDFLNHELSGPGGSVQAASQLIQDLVDFSTRTQALAGDQPFWPLSAARKLRMAMTVVHKALGSCSVDDLHRFSVTMPRTAEERDGEPFRGTFCCKCLVAAAERGRDGDLALAADFVLEEWIRLGSKTTGSVDAYVMNLVEKFLHGSVRDLVASGATNLSPDDVLAGRIVVVDMPVLKYREPGQFVQMVWKLATQRAALRRAADPEARDVVLWCDEAHLHALSSVDSLTQAVARSHRLIQVAITQSIPLLVSTLKNRDDVLAWLANLQTKFLFANGDKDSNEYFSALLGHSRHLFGGMNGSVGPYDPIGEWLGQESPGGYSLHEQWHADVPPDAFTRLRKGGRENGCIVDAFVFQGGRVFSTGKTWIRASFRQRPS